VREWLRILARRLRTTSPIDTGSPPPVGHATRPLSFSLITTPRPHCIVYVRGATRVLPRHLRAAFNGELARRLLALRGQYVRATAIAKAVLRQGQAVQ
jgi:hypothetical protein